MEEKRKENKPESNRSALIDHSVSLRVPVGEEEVQNNVDEEGNLAYNVEYKQFLFQTPEKPELERCEEGRVHCPSQYHFRPNPIPPAFVLSNFSTNTSERKHQTSQGEISKGTRPV